MQESAASQTDPPVILAAVRLPGSTSTGMLKEEETQSSPREVCGDAGGEGGVKHIDPLLDLLNNVQLGDLESLVFGFRR